MRRPSVMVRTSSRPESGPRLPSRRVPGASASNHSGGCHCAKTWPAGLTCRRPEERLSLCRIWSVDQVAGQQDDVELLI